ncbi:MAG: hypothetical protein J6Y78_01855 [Paludibacteraceae bacterium]|nr:hypothetical protein [Paludibacteraceae bacterium]
MEERFEKAQFHIANAIEQLYEIKGYDTEDILESLWSADAMIDDALYEIGDEEEEED